MKYFKQDGTYYLVFKEDDVDNPTKNTDSNVACILDTKTDLIPVGHQKQIMKDYLAARGVAVEDNLTTRQLVYRVAALPQEEVR